MIVGPWAGGARRITSRELAQPQRRALASALANLDAVVPGRVRWFLRQWNHTPVVDLVVRHDKLGVWPPQRHSMFTSTIIGIGPRGGLRGCPMAHSRNRKVLAWARGGFVRAWVAEWPCKCRETGHPRAHRTMYWWEDGRLLAVDDYNMANPRISEHEDVPFFADEELILDRRLVGTLGRNRS